MKPNSRRFTLKSLAITALAVWSKPSIDRIASLISIILSRLFVIRLFQNQAKLIVAVFISFIGISSASAQTITPVYSLLLEDAPAEPTCLLIHPTTDFESGIPSDWLLYSNDASDPMFLANSVSTVGDVDVMALPGQVGNNNIMDISGDLSGGGEFGGVGQQFVTARDIRGYDAFGFWFFGSNTGESHELRLQSGGPSNSDSISFTEDFSGWQYLVFPFYLFSTLAGNFNPQNFSAWLLVLDGFSGSIYLDDVAVLDENVLVDFEGGLPARVFVYSHNVVDVTASAPIVSDTSLFTLPGQVGNNQFLDINSDLQTAEWGGAGQGDLDWDLSNTEVIGFWMYGTNTAQPFEFRLESGGSNANAIGVSLVDDFSGWKQVVLPLNIFSAIAGSFDSSDVTAWLFVMDEFEGNLRIDNIAEFNRSPSNPCP